MACQKSHHLPCDYSLFLPALILTTAVLSCLPGAPSAPGCLAASGRQARLRQAAAGAPRACSDRSGRAASVAPWPALLASRQKAAGM
nr:hypothetical protein [Escherichia coli]